MSDQTETPWTPGPWRRRHVPKAVFDEYIAADKGELDVNIARVYGGGADARLIAKAPEMVALLEEIASTTDIAYSTEGAEIPWEILDKIEPLLTQIREGGDSDE